MFSTTNYFPIIIRDGDIVSFNKQLLFSQYNNQHNNRFLTSSFNLSKANVEVYDRLGLLNYKLYGFDIFSLLFKVSFAINVTPHISSSEFNTIDFNATPLLEPSTEFFFKYIPINCIIIHSKFTQYKPQSEY